MCQASNKLQAFYNLLVREILSPNSSTPTRNRKDSVSSFIKNRKDVLEIGQVFHNKSSFFSCYLFVTWLETIISLLVLYFLGYVGFPIVISVSIEWYSKIIIDLVVLLIHLAIIKLFIRIIELVYISGEKHPLQCV